MKSQISIFLLIIIPLFLSCSNSDDSMITDPDPDPDPTGDTSTIPDKISTYEGDVKAIMTQHCISCHGIPLENAAPMELVTYDQVVDAVNNRDLIRRVSTSSIFTVMPSSGRLPQATIDLILDWDDDGLIEQ